MAEGSALRRMLDVPDVDASTRVRATNALVIIYGMVALGLLSALPLMLIPSGGFIALVVVATDLVWLGAAMLIRRGKVDLGLAIFLGLFLLSFPLSVALTQESRLTPVYLVTPVTVAVVTLHRRGLALVTAAAVLLAVGIEVTWPTQSPITSTEVLLAGAVVLAVTVVAGLLGMWGQRQETKRADNSARRATELAERLRVTNAELERRVDERTEALQRALSQQETLVAELADLSLRDPLTGLYNRRHVEHELPRLLAASERHGQPLALALADLDHFKNVNDSHSYSAGDEVLLRFTEVLRDTARADDLLIRYGGEEFLVVMPQTSLDQALVLCERLRERVEQHSWHEVVPELRLTVSIGVADSLGRPTPGDVTAAADVAVHAAKRNGRNRVEQAPSPDGATLL